MIMDTIRLVRKLEGYSKKYKQVIRKSNKFMANLEKKLTMRLLFNK